MNKAHLMTDSFFAMIMFRIELQIHQADQAAAAAGLVLKDSHVKSCLSKAKILAKGQRPKSEPQSPREERILKLAEDIDGLRAALRAVDTPDAGADAGESISTSDWISAIQAVEGSLKNYTVSGSRNYLDFLTGFMAEARVEESEATGGKPRKWWHRIFRQRV